MITVFRIHGQSEQGKEEIKYRLRVTSAVLCQGFELLISKFWVAQTIMGERDILHLLFVISVNNKELIYIHVPLSIIRPHHPPCIPT